MNRELEDPSAAVLEREMLQHIPVVSWLTMGLVEEAGGSGDRTGDKVTTWPGLCCSRLISAAPAPDPPVWPLGSHLRPWLGL